MRRALRCALGALRCAPGALWLLAACGGGAPADDGGGPVDGALCVGDAPAVDAALEVGPPADGGAAFCGGALALAGVTPFGPFAPDAVSVEVLLPPQPTLRVTLAQEPPAGTQLTFDVPGDAATGAFLGAHDVAGFLEGGGVVMPVMVHVDVTTATPATELDGGPPGAASASMSVVVTTDCGSFSGTIDARYCGAEPPM